MAFDNVTLLEINIEDFPLGGDETADESARIDRSAETDRDGEASSGSGVLRYALAAVTMAALAALAGWLLRRRRGDEAADFETETVEPGVERVDP